ncbi:MAG TPA: MarR family transcriptional regulator [Candidatus Acidoferrum sp.]|nr:MarR family transcriptional regulator [Candidatus Acidoferrum sp.]
MIAVDRKLIPEEIFKDSVLIHLAAAYFAVSKRLEQKTHCSETRGFILSTLRGGAVLNQNQIAVLLGMDRTVVHRAVKALVREGLVSERKASAGRALLLQLTPQGHKYRESLIRERRAADEALRRKLSPNDRARLLRLLNVVADTEF